MPSESPYGTFDQGGNLWEWNETLMVGSQRGHRGGRRGGNPNYLLASYRNHHDPTLETSWLGFRLASPSAIPEPSSFLLLSLGAAGLFACGRRRRRRVA